MTILAGVNFAAQAWSMDNESFKPRQQYIWAAILALGGLHLMFNANPVVKPADKKN